jgi:hypothetical protein
MGATQIGRIDLGICLVAHPTTKRSSAKSRAPSLSRPIPRHRQKGARQAVTRTVNETVDKAMPQSRRSKAEADKVEC